MACTPAIRKSEGAALIPELSGVTDAIRGFARGGNGRGRGGMETKLEAVRIANEAQPARGDRQRPHARYSRHDLRRQDRRHAVFARETLREAPEHIREPLCRSRQAGFARASPPAPASERNRALKPSRRASSESAAANPGRQRRGHAARRKPRSRAANCRARWWIAWNSPPAKLASMIAGVRAVAALPDPIGRVLDRIELDTGLELEKVSCPLGLLAVIFEARPEAVTQISFAGDQVGQRA